MTPKNATLNIINNLTNFSYKIQSENQRGYFDINREAEMFYCGLINSIFDYQLIIAPKAGSQNFIDLVDNKNKVAFELTTNPTIAKISNIIEKINQNKLYTLYDAFYIFSLTKKLGNYDQIKVGNNFKLEIIDSTDLESIILKLPPERINIINHYIINSLNIDQPNDDLRKRLEEFIRIISKPDIHEPEITTFLSLEKNQFILKLFFGAIKIFNQKECEWQIEIEKNNLIPDFFIEASNGFSDIVDFKLPTTKKLIVGIENREHFSAKINEYISQIENYRDYFDDTLNREWVRQKYSITLIKQSITLVIGRRGDFSKNE